MSGSKADVLRRRNTVKESVLSRQRGDYNGPFEVCGYVQKAKRVCQIKLKGRMRMDHEQGLEALA